MNTLKMFITGQNVIEQRYVTWTLNFCKAKNVFHMNVEQKICIFRERQSNILVNNNSTTKYSKIKLRRKRKTFCGLSMTSSTLLFLCFGVLNARILHFAYFVFFICLQFCAALTRDRVTDAYQLLFFQARTDPPPTTRTI